MAAILRMSASVFRCSTWLPFVAGALLIFASPHRARADDFGDFSLTLTPYIWLPGIHEPGGADPVAADEWFTDIATHDGSSPGLFGRADARLGRFGLYVDAGHAALAFDRPFGEFGEHGTETADLDIVEFGLMYRIGRWPSGDATPGVSVDVLGGGRYTRLDDDFDDPSFGTEHTQAEWFDPIIGAEATVDFTSHWRLKLHGDFGGFGLGSEQTWSTVATVAYRFHIHDVESSVFVGYKVLGEDYNKNIPFPFEEFSWDNFLHGPVAGLSFTF